MRGAEKCRTQQSEYTCLHAWAQIILLRHFFVSFDRLTDKTSITQTEIQMVIPMIGLSLTILECETRSSTGTDLQRTKRHRRTIKTRPVSILFVYDLKNESTHDRSNHSYSNVTCTRFCPLITCRAGVKSFLVYD